MEILCYTERFVDKTEHASHSRTGTGIYEASNSDRLQLYLDLKDRW
jgi:hypothetical protein